MSTPEPRELIRHDIFTLGAGVVRRPVRGEPGSERVPHPEPLTGIGAAVSLKHAAVSIIRDCARYAREDGITWEGIAAALGCQPDAYGTSAGEVAFRDLASDLGDGLSFTWRCAACGQLIRDRGPESFHPADVEEGHGDGCSRLAAAIAAWDRQWEDDGDAD